MLEEEEIRYWMRHLLHALYCVHVEHQIIHRDIKPQNLLLKKRINSSLLPDDHNVNSTFSYKDYDLQLADFGLSKPLKHDELANSFAGTLGYISLEVLRRHSYAKKADMWSVGCIALLFIRNGRFSYPI